MKELSKRKVIIYGTNQGTVTKKHKTYETVKVPRMWSSISG